jgi:X-X-X-Leu-X-X-Gly heptad repeat protein
VTTPVTTPATRRAAIFAAGYFALCIAWIAVLPLFAGPDEPANFIKSAAVVRLRFVGEPIPPSASTSFWSTYVDIDERFGVAQQVPWCFVGQPQAAACDKPLASLAPVERARTDMGRYPPLGFVPAGIGTFVGPSDAGARAARVTGAVVACALLGLAAALLRRRGKSLAPLLAVATPGVIFLSAVSSPSGFEIAAAITAWTALWLCVAERWSRASTVTTFMIAAALLVAARPAGAVTVAVMLGAAALADHRTLLGTPRRDWRSWVILTASVMVSGGWYVTVYDANLGAELDIETRVEKLTTVVTRSLADLPRLVGESVGNFGWLDTPSPTLVVWTFVALTAAFAWRAFDPADRRVRAAISVAALAVPAWHIVLNRNYQDLLGTFGAQGRHLTPFIVGIPLAAVMRRAPRASDRVVATVVVLAHLWCVLVAMRRYSLGAGGDDLLGFLRAPVWSPPLGITGTLVVVAFAHAAAWFAFVHGVGRVADGVGTLADGVGRMER